MIQNKKCQQVGGQPYSRELNSVFYIDIINNYSFEAYVK